MILQWKLENFKSIKQASVRLRPLTFIAGANNVGKSSLIQSILLVAQTVNGRTDSKTLELNGQFFRFGYFEHIKPILFESKSTVFTFICEPPRTAFREAFFPGRRTSPNLSVVRVQCEFTDHLHGHDVSNVNLNPILINTSVTCLFESSPGNEPLDAFFSAKYDSSTQELVAALTSSGVTDQDLHRFDRALSFRPTLDDPSAASVLEDQFEGNLVGCELSHFLPVVLVARYNQQLDLADYFVRQLARSPSIPGNLWEDVELSKVILELLRKIVATEFPTIAKVLSPSSDTSIIRLRDWQTAVRKLHIGKQRRLKKAVLAIEAELTDAIVAGFLSSLPSQSLKALSLPPRIAEGVAYVQKLFSSSVKYLGPLRDEPKSIYQLRSFGGDDDIGLRGEFTASVLHHRRDALIKYYPPHCFAGGPFKLVETTLKDAVEDWLSYLGMGETLVTKEEGPLGHTLKIILPGSSVPLDLTHVGVGVSQMLPVLVFGLLGQPDDTLIMEQPELHLHPRAQTRLADFLLSLSLCGKQCIVETHSEHIIKRIRMRIAEEDGTALQALVGIYFAEASSEGTQFREIELNQYGALVDWPEGFFDQSEKESQSIIRAALDKRRKQSKKHGTDNS